MNYSDQILSCIKRENFVRYSNLDRVKSLKRILPHLALLPFAITAIYIKTGQSGLDIHQLAKLMVDQNKRLIEDRPKMKSERGRRLCDLTIELNNLGIEGTNAADVERSLQRTCLKLKSEIRMDHSLSKAKSFVEIAKELSTAREAMIQIMKDKNAKQQEIVRAIEEVPVFKGSDLRDLLETALIDALYSREADKPHAYATMVKLGELSARIVARRFQKMNMSPKVLARAIWLRERALRRFEEWSQSVPNTSLLPKTNKCIRT